MNRFLDQAREYQGTPKRFAALMDEGGEYHVLIEMELEGGQVHYLDWIGGEYAEEPDEWGDDTPNYKNIIWKRFK